MNAIIKNIIIFPAIIAVCYWFTDRLLYPGLSNDLRAWIVIKSFGLPLISIAVFLFMSLKMDWKSRNIIIIGCLAVLWIWLLSSCYLPVMNLIKPSEVKISIKDFGVFLLMFPFTAIEISTYSGGLLGLALTTIGLPISAIILAKNKKAIMTS